MPRSATCLRIIAARRAPIRGFIFVELLFVLAIISILVAIALPAYRDYELRAEAAEGLVFLGDAKSSVNEFYARWGRMPANNSEAGLRLPDALRGKFVRRVSVSDGVMVAMLQLGNEEGGDTLERTLTFRPWLNAKNPGAPILWSCGERDPVANDYHAVGDVAPNPVESKWLPSVCRKQ